MNQKGKVVIISQSTHVAEALGYLIVYRKVCESCGVGVRARSRGKRVCPACGGHLRKATDEEAATDKFLG